MAKNILLDYMKNKQTQSSQAASTGSGRSIDSQQAAWDQALKEKPSTWNPEPIEAPKTNPLLSSATVEEPKPKKKGFLGITIPDGSENPWDYDATNNIIDTSVPAKPAETPKVEEPKAPEKKQLEYSDAFLKQEDQKDAWQPTYENGKSIKQIEAEASPKEETDYSKQNIIQKAWTIAKSIDRQAGNNFLSNISGAASSLLGEGTFANELWTIIGSTLNSFGADIDVNKNPVSEWREGRTERQKYDATQYAEMFKDDPVAQTISKYGTMVATQVPSAMLSIMTAMTAAPLTATTESLNYISALNNSKGFTQLATMATQGLKKVAGDPQFWMSYSQESGSAYNEAIADGATPEMASLYSTVDGILAAMIEVGGADEALGGAQNFPKEAVDAYKAGDTKRASWEFVKSIFGEIGEEEQQEALGAYLKKLYKDVPLYSDNEWTINMDGSTVPTPEGVADNDAVINFDRMIDTAIDTAITTTLLVGGESAITKAATASDTKQAKEAASNALLAGLEGELVNKGLDVDTAAEVANILAKSAQGQRLTKKEKNILMEIRNREDVAAGSNEVATPATETVEEQATPVPSQELEVSPAAEGVVPPSIPPAPATQQAGQPSANKSSQVETGLDTAQENQNPLLTATGVTPETQTNRGVNPNKAAQVQTELDKRSERIAEIQQEIADLEQQPPSPERNDEILRLVEEQTQLTQENAAEGQQENPLIQQEETETAQETETAPETEPVAQEETAQTAEEETEEEQNASAEETTEEEKTAQEPTTEQTTENQTEQDTDTVEEEYNALGQKYGTMEPGEKAARDAAMPKQVSDDTRNTQSVRSVVESANTPEERIPAIRSAVVQGKTSYRPTTNAQLAQEAGSKIEEDGLEKSLRDWTSAVRSGQANEQLVAEGAVLLTKVANNPNYTDAEYIDIMLDLASLENRLGRALSAARIMKTLSPEGKLYAFQKIVQKMNNDAKESKKSKRQKAKQEKANRQAAAELAEEIKKDMSNLVFTFEYSDEAAQIVANAVARKANPKSNRSTPTSLEQLAKTIAKFAAERIQTKKNASNSMTATQILAELSNNEEFAREVYELAQQQTRNTPNADAFSNEAMNLADSRIVQRALAEAALDTNENNETIRNQAALGMPNEQIAQYLADYLIEAVDASESMSNAIHDAALNYVNNVLNNDTKTEEARVNSLVNQIMNQIGEQFYNLAKSDSYTRDTARQAIIDTLTERYGIDGSSANAIADAIAADFDAKLQNAIQDQLQKRFGDKVKNDTAAAQTANKLTEAVNLGAFDSEYASRAINKLFGVNGEYTLDPDLVEEYRQQTTDEGRDAVLEKMQQDIADQVPATLKDKFTALRYLNMLGNLKTQARNILGNIGNMAMYKAKNTVRSAIESLLGTDKQYSAFYGADLRRVSSQYFDSNSDVQKEAMGSNKFASVAKQYKQEIEDKRRIFKSNILEGYRHLTDKMMNEIGDKIFVKATFTDALAGYLKAHDITAEQWNALVTEANGDPSSEAAGIVDEATQFAIKQAQEATFRDTNAVSKAFSEFDSNWPNLLKTLSQGVIPFRKTPANVLVRMEEFSPLGFANTAFKAIQKGMGSENVTGADIIDSFSKALTGSGLSVLGYFLAAAGKARTKSDDDKEEAYAKLMGLQDYSITIGGHNFTMDWLTPESASFFMGVELYNLLKDGTVPPEAAMRMLGNLTSPMLEMSMLSGLNDALDNIADYNGDTEALPQLVLNSAWGYLSQGITNTLIGQLEQANEEYRQSYYTNPDNPFLTPAMQKMLAKAGNKTPGIDYQAADYIDAWGRKQENFSNPLARYAYALGSPSYISSLGKQATEVDEELQRLYDYGKDIDRFPNVFPQQTQRSTKVNGTRLSPEEYDMYATAKGQKSLELVSDLIKSDEYKNMTDDEKAAAVNDMYSYATQLAAEKVADSREEDYDFSDNRYERMKSAEDKGISAAQYYGYYQKYRDLRDDKSLTAQQKAEKFATYIINQRGLNETQKSLLRDSFKFTTTLVADTNSYDKWIAAGLTPEQAEGFNKKINTDGSKSISNAERYAAIEQYATDAEMAEKLWEAMGSSTWTKSGKSYFKANPSSKFRNSWSGKTYSTPKSSSSSSSSSDNPLLKNWGGGSSSGTSNSTSSSGNILLNNWNRG